MVSSLEVEEVTNTSTPTEVLPHRVAEEDTVPGKIADRETWLVSFIISERKDSEILQLRSREIGPSLLNSARINWRSWHQLSPKLLKMVPRLVKYMQLLPSVDKFMSLTLNWIKVAHISQLFCRCLLVKFFLEYKHLMIQWWSALPKRIKLIFLPLR